MPITRPAAKALSDAMDKPKVSPMFLIKGPTVKAAKKPYTTVGIPASISKRGLTIVLVLWLAYSARYIAASKPIGIATTHCYYSN